MTGHLHSYGKIIPTNTGGISQVRVNGDFSRGFDDSFKNNNTKWVEEIFHKLSKEISIYLVNMFIWEVTSARASYRPHLSKQ